MKKRIPAELIDRYLKGACSPEEESELHRWYNSFDNEPAPITSLNENQKISLKKRMLDKIKQQADMDEEGTQARVVKISRSYWYSVASIAALFILVLSFFIKNNYLNKEIAGTQVSVYVSVVNHSNKLVKHTFPDGSIAWMRPSTNIRYKRAFNSGALREVSMLGEAFYEVTRNPKKPFIIHSGNVDTKVLGTSFNVRCYSANSPAEVSVVTGKVMVSTHRGAEAKESVYLLPKERVVYNKEDKSLVKDFSVKQEMALWTKNTLSFNNIPMSSVVSVLRDKFQTNITIASPEINKYLLTADFTDANLPSVLEMLSKSLDITYAISEDGISMSKP